MKRGESVFWRFMRLFREKNEEKPRVTVTDRRSEVVSMRIPWPELPKK